MPSGCYQVSRKLNSALKVFCHALLLSRKISDFPHRQAGRKKDQIANDEREQTATPQTLGTGMCRPLTKCPLETVWQIDSTSKQIIRRVVIFILPLIFRQVCKSLTDRVLFFLTVSFCGLIIIYLSLIHI